MADGKLKSERSRYPEHFLSHREQKVVLEAIREAEKDCSGEIRVHIARKADKTALEEAKAVFIQLGMEKTKLRNGVLLYFAIENRAFAILGDSGIDAKMGQALWDETAKVMSEHFRSGDFAGGLSYCIRRIGEILKTHFPYQSDDVNELPDDLSFG